MHKPPSPDAPARRSEVSLSEAGPSPWSPLQQAAFRAVWLALLAANIGTWMQRLGAAWLWSAWMLLAFTLLLGLGAALTAPAWPAIVPELVNRAERPAAVALQARGFNVARAVGPMRVGPQRPLRRACSCAGGRRAAA